MTTTNELHIMLVEMRGDIKAILHAQNSMKEWQEKHERNDNENFIKLEDKVDSMGKYGSSIAMVAGFVGSIVGWFSSRMMGS